MDFFKNIYAQGKDLYLGMTPGSRVIAGLLAVVLLISLGYLVAGSATGGSGADNDFVYMLDGHQFSRSEIALCEAAFAKNGLSNYQWIGFKLRVPFSSRDKYAAAIYAENCVTNIGDNSNKAAESISPLDTTLSMEFKMRQASAKDLAEAISRFPGVENASVLVNRRMDRDPKFYDKKYIYSATVNVWPMREEYLSDELLASITRATRGSLGIQDLDDISIINGKLTQVSKGTEVGMQGGEKSYAEVQRETEKRWNEKIKGLFQNIPGMVVKTSVELSDVMSDRQHYVIHTDKPTDVMTRMTSSDFKQTDADRAYRPGFEAQWGMPLDPTKGASIAGGTKSEKTKTNEVSSALQGKEGERILAPLMTRMVTASIQIPKSYILELWKANNPAAPAAPAEAGAAPAAPVEPTAAELAQIELAELERIRSLVANLIKADVKDETIVDPSTLVQVTTFRDRSPEIEQEPEIAGLFSWFGEQWQTLALLGVVILGLGVLWSVTRPKANEPIVIYEAPMLSPEALGVEGEGEEDEEEIAFDRVLEPFSKSMRSLQQEVADLVVENPDAAASVIRQWIGNVAVQER